MAERIKAVKVLEGDFDDEGLSTMVNGYDDPTDKIFKDTVITKRICRVLIVAVMGKGSKVN